MSRENLSAHIGIDFGASSGRAIVGVLNCENKNRKIVELHEQHRFEHHPVELPVGPVWDLTGIWRETLLGLQKSIRFCQDQNIPVESVGVDTWGVDWVLLGSSGELLALPHCYRDPQNVPASERVLETVGGKFAIYNVTGIQHMPINTLFQVAARFEKEPDLFSAARHLVFMPDLFHFWLTGNITVERTIASTSSMLDVRTGEWAYELLEKIGLPTHFLGPIIEPGTTVGNLRPELVSSLGLDAPIQVVAPATHDTGAAVAAVPVQTEQNWAYLSSGTWSLLGAELEQPIVTEAACDIPFTNELGVDKTIRFLQNISGLWMVQELRRELNAKSSQPFDFGQLMEMATMATPFRTLVNPNAPEFLGVGDMAGKIKRFAKATSQPEPETTGDLIRTCIDSLAMCYSETLADLERLIGHRIQVLHIVGGGSQNQLLNQVTADAIVRPVVCGPVETTALGNVLIQAMGCGKIKDLNELRETVCNSFEPQTVQPVDYSAAELARERYRQLPDSA